MAEQNIDVIDFSTLTSANDGQTVLYSNGALYQSSGTISQLVDNKVATATSDFATTNYVDTEIGKVGNYVISVADASGRPDIDPTSAGMKNIYLIKDDAASGIDQYKEWIVTEADSEKSWTCIGDTSINLSDYYTKTEVDTALSGINEVPVSTSVDEGKVLTVNSNGNAAWANAGGSSETFVVRALIYEGADILNDAIIMDKTYSEIDTAYKAGKNVEIHFYPVDSTPSSTSDIDTEFENESISPFIAKLELVSSGTGPDMQLHNAYRFTFKNLDLIYTLNYWQSSNVYAYSRKYSSIIIDIQSYSNYVTAIANNMNQQNIIIGIDDTEWTAGQWNNFYNLLIYYLNSHDSLTFRIYTASNHPYRLLRLARYQPEYSNTTAYFEFIGFNSFSSYDKLTITPVTESGQTLVHYKFETISST